MNFFKSPKFDRNAFTSNLKMAMTRMNLLINKKRNAINLEKRVVAQLISEEKDENARIKVENIIREDYSIEAMNILMLFCELAATRARLIEESKKCPHDMKEAVHSLIYAASRLEVKELVVIRQQFLLKYGKEFVAEASENKDLAVNQRIVFKLGVLVPESYLCIQYLKEIAKQFGVKFEEKKTEEEKTTLPGLNNQYGGNNQGGNGGGDFMFGNQIQQQQQLQGGMMNQQQFMMYQQNLMMQQQMQEQLRKQQEEIEALRKQQKLKENLSNTISNSNVMSSGYSVDFNPDNNKKDQNIQYTNKIDPFAYQNDTLSEDDILKQQVQQSQRLQLKKKEEEELKKQKDLFDQLKNQQSDDLDKQFDVFSNYDSSSKGGESVLKKEEKKEEKEDEDDHLKKLRSQLENDSFDVFDDKKDNGDDGDDFDDLQKRFENLKK